MDIKVKQEEDADEEVDIKDIEEVFVDIKQEDDDASDSDTNAPAAKKDKNQQKGPFTCDLCGKVCKHIGNLRRHQATHASEEPYCSTCDKYFTKRIGLNRHNLLVHSDRSACKFVCDTCGKRFLKKGHLDEHLLRHEGVKGFKCVICEKAFFSKRNLQSHLRLHLDEKPYSCLICDKRFTHVRSLNLHSEKAHGKFKQDSDGEDEVEESSACEVNGDVEEIKHESEESMSEEDNRLPVEVKYLPCVEWNKKNCK